MTSLTHTPKSVQKALHTFEETTSQMLEYQEGQSGKPEETHIHDEEDTVVKWIP